jgi:hypothetical protein
LSEFTDTDHDDLANKIVDKLVERMSDEETVETIIAVWSKQFDQTLGRGLRRILFALLLVIGGALAVKFDIITWLGPK